MRRKIYWDLEHRQKEHEKAIQHGQEAGEGEGILQAVLLGVPANVVAVVEGDRASLLESDHGLHVRDDARSGPALVFVGVRRSERDRVVATATATLSSR